jgi:hypothetical protein
LLEKDRVVLLSYYPPAFDICKPGRELDHLNAPIRESNREKKNGPHELVTPIITTKFTHF